MEQPKISFTAGDPPQTWTLAEQPDAPEWRRWVAARDETPTDAEQLLGFRSSVSAPTRHELETAVRDLAVRHDLYRPELQERGAR